MVMSVLKVASKKSLFLCLLLCLISIQSLRAQVVSATQPEIKIDKFILSVGYQTAWRVAATDASSQAERDYFRDLKRGSGIRLKGLVPLGDQESAVGLTYNAYKSKTGQLNGDSEFHEINYIGALYQLYTRSGPQEEHLFVLESSIGYMSYQSVINGVDIFDGGNLALSFGGAYRYMVSPVIGIGFDLHLEGTTIQEWNGPGGQSVDLGDGDNLYRLSLSFGVDVRL